MSACPFCWFTEAQSGSLTYLEGRKRVSLFMLFYFVSHSVAFALVSGAKHFIFIHFSASRARERALVHLWNLLHLTCGALTAHS